MHTREELTVSYGFQKRKVRIPQGSGVVPADNLEKGGYWLDEIPEDWPLEAQSWAEVYGIWLSPEEVAA